MACWIPGELTLCVEGLLSFFNTIKRIPIIRYDSLSRMSTELAQELDSLLPRAPFAPTRPGYLDDRETILLILDRRSDMLTPLLIPWTYQSILHELFGITNGRVDATKDLYSELRSSDSEQIFDLRIEEDEFYSQNLDSNFGELGENVKSLVASLHQRTLENRDQMVSVPNMKRFLEYFPEYKKLTKIARKHVALTSELAKRIDEHSLLSISELEQKLISDDELPSVQNILSSVDQIRSSLTRLLLILALCIKRRPTEPKISLFRAILDILPQNALSVHFLAFSELNFVAC